MAGRGEARHGGARQMQVNTKLEGKIMAKKENAELKQMDIRQVVIGIKGLTPLIMHRWSEKAKKDMLDKQMGKTAPKEKKNPEEQYESAKYVMDDGRLGFPADAFKKAMVRGAKQLGLTMTDMRTGFFVHGEYSEKEDRELVAIEGACSMREDTVRLSGGTSDIRYRPQVTSWTAKLQVSYNANITTLDYIVNMISAAGYGVGIGDWRPERDGIFGRFEIVDVK